MYGGCILRNGKTLDQYQIKDGCTLHVMQHKKKGTFIGLRIYINTLTTTHTLTCVLCSEVCSTSIGA